MALDERLISRMESEAAPAGEEQPQEEKVESWESPIDPVPETTDPAPEPVPAPAPTPNPAPNPTPAPAPEGYEPLFQAIQRQLADVNRSIARLETAVAGKETTPNKAMADELAVMKRTLSTILAEVTKPQTPPAPTADPAMEELMAMMRGLVEKVDRNDRQLSQSLRENANFQIQVRQGMQKDLDKLKQQQMGEQFNPILKEISQVYVEYQTLLQEELSDRVRKNLEALFDQLKDVLEDNDAEVCATEVGAVRPMRQCKIVQKIPTGDKALHNTIAKSRKPGVVRDRVILYPESVDVYVYDEALDIPEPEPVPEEIPVPETPAEPPVAPEQETSDPEEIPAPAETETVNPAGEEPSGV